MTNTLVEAQSTLYLEKVVIGNTSYTEEDGNLITEFTYDDTIKVYVEGGSGDGQLIYTLHSETGVATLETVIENAKRVAVLSFVKPGTVLLSAYRKESSDSHATYQDDPIYYGKSKQLTIQFTLKQRQVIITVRPDIELRIGSSIPNINSFSTVSSGLQGSDALYQSPEKYYVYNSDDFYKFDVMCKAISQNRYINGVLVEKDSLGYWTISGSILSAGITEVKYDLIVSPSKFPTYLVKNRIYRLESNNLYIHNDSGYNGVDWIIEVYRQDGSYYMYNSQIHGNSYDFIVPEDAVGIYSYLLMHRNYSFDVDITLHMYDVEERKMNTKIASTYPVAARGAVLPVTGVAADGYIQPIQYRSARLTYVNTQQYRVIANYDHSLGTVTVFPNKALPYEEVEIQIKAKFGIYFTGVSTNAGTLEKISSEQYDEQEDHYSSAVYKLTMPISDVRLYVEFINNYENYGSNVPFTDISGLPSQFVNAIKFCYYARHQKFRESPPLMQGYSSNKFYQSLILRKLRREEMVTVIRRISHVINYTPSYSPSSLDIGTKLRAELDTAFLSDCNESNSPIARLYTYAGYPHISEVIDPDTSESTGEYVVDDSLPIQVTPTNTFPTSYNGDSSMAFPADRTYGANDDYLRNILPMPHTSWTSWIGVAKGYSEQSFAPYTYATYEEVATMLWRYAKFRQFDIMTEGSQQFVDESDVSYWAQNGPIRWAVTRGIIPNRNVDGNLIVYSDYIDKAEFAYMIMKFCQLYAW